jgi:multiple antibiotic resistance protein
VNHINVIKELGTFLAIMNPFLILPVFLSMTSGLSVHNQRILAAKITIFSSIMCLIILFAGKGIIGFFGITVDQFRVAGGIVLTHIAWNMLNGNSIPSHEGNSGEQVKPVNISTLAFYPLTFPLVVGPGTIATIILYTSLGPSSGKPTIIAIIGAILLLMFALLFFATEIGKVMSDTMRTITTRLMGMILLSIAVSMIADGLYEIFPGLAH